MTHHDPASLLATPARLIAENDQHVVIAIRIPKSWIGANLSFLAALVDSVIGKPTGRDTPRPKKLAR